MALSLGGTGAAHINYMKRAHSPTMDDTEPPISPRKKLKLEEPSFNAKQADTVMEAPPIPEVIPHHHTAPVNHQLSKPTTMGSADIPSSIQTFTTPAKVSSMFTNAVPESKIEDSHNLSEASGDLPDKNAMNATKAKPGTADVTNSLDGHDSKEAAYGITEFVSRDLLGFSGIVKKRYTFLTALMHSLANLHRYTDFLVNEILPSGEVVHLDNLKAPPKAPKNTELLRNAGDASRAHNIEQKADAPQSTTKPNSKEQEQIGTTRGTTSTNEQQTLSDPDSSNQERSTSNPKENRPVVEAPQTIPQSMQGFNQYELSPTFVDSQKKISPHKRNPPPAPSIPHSMQDLDGKQPEPKQEQATRRKEKVHIRQTSQGWIEFDKEKEDEAKKPKAEEDAAARVQPEDATQMEDMESEEFKNGPELKEPDLEQVPKASTEASWQAFAGSAPSNSFEVRSRSTRHDIH